MADRVYMPTPLDSNGDVVSDAAAYFYERGTTTPLTVYTDENAGTPHASPVTMVDGAFPAVFTTQALKVDIVDGLGASIPGYPIDPAYVSQATSLAASGITFSPITGNAATNVQAAIQNLTTLWNAVTTFSRTLLGKSTAADWRTTLELGGLSTLDILDEDDFASDSATRPPSQQSTKAYVDAEVAANTYPPTWATITGGGSPTVVAGSNVASVTQDGAGLYTITFSTAFSNTDYAVFGNVLGTGTGATVNRFTVNVRGDGAGTGASVKTTTAVQVYIVNPGSGGAVDPPRFYIHAIGT